MRLILALTFGISSLYFGYAQTTGNFLLNVTFPQVDYNENRNLYFFVPSDYDASQTYPLVVGFRGGPHSNAGQFRDQLRFLSDSLNAIVLCPENSHHFNNQEGLVKKLFQYAVDTTSSMYNIDENKIYLTGLSYGGRHAVIVAMDTDAGPIPTIRGLIPFAAGTASQDQPNYSAVAEFAPACVCIGLNDSPNFITVSQTLNTDIMNNGGTVLFNEIPGVGHTVVFPDYPLEMMECFDFIESSYTAVHEYPSLTNLGIDIYPNPVIDVLHIERKKEVEIDKIEIRDVNGLLIRAVKSNASEINLTTVDSGVYILVVVAKEKRHAQKFIIQK